MKKIQTILMALFAVIAMVGCVNTPDFVLPDTPPTPVPPTPTPGELPLISTDPAFVTEAMTEDITIILNTAGIIIEE